MCYFPTVLLSDAIHNIFLLQKMKMKEWSSYGLSILDALLLELICVVYG